MTTTLLFIHGTGEHDVTGSTQQIADGVYRILGWPSDRVIPLEWGDAVAPADLDIRPALPPRVATRGLGDELTPAEQAAALWDVLLADPLVELRVMAVTDAEQGGIVVNQALPSAALRGALAALVISPESLASAGIVETELRAAANAVGDSSELGEAADRVGDAQDPELIAAVARAVVASAIVMRSGASSTRPLPRIAYDAAVRDQFVGDVAEELVAGTRGLGRLFMQTVVAPLATKLAVAKRADFMGPLSDFLRDIAFYIARGELVRDWLATAIRRYAEEADRVVVLAHSLGGIAAVDLLSDPTVAADPRGPLKVDLLVTAGSQAPLLFLMDALHSLRPGHQHPAPFSPWLNVYNRDDLLSFCAAGVWPGAAGIFDEEVAPGIPFPASHSAYWAADRLYELIGERLP